MLKILQARLQWYVNQELPDVQAEFRRGRGISNQMAKIRWIIEKAREFRKNIDFCFIDYAKAFDCVDHNKLWRILQKTGIPDHLTCLLRTLYAGQEATVRNRHGTMDWFQTGKRYVKVVYCHPGYLIYMMLKYIIRNTRLDDTSWNQDCWRNNLRYADDTTHTAESKEEQKRASWWKWKRRVKKLA